MFTRPRLRSNTGCMPCKKRRKKCDEQKPTCGTCQRVNRRCFWVPDTDNTAAHTLVKCSDPVLEFFIRRLRQEPNLSKTIDLSGFQDRICAAHVLETCFKSSNSPFDPINTQRNGWSIQSTLNFAPVGESLAWDCFLAHGEMFVGNRYKNRGLFEAGLIKYDILVKRMRSVIEDEKTRCGYDILAAISNLGTFGATRSWSGRVGEIHESVGACHTAGMLAILESMHPRKFQDDRALAFFENIRLAGITIAILFGQETTLASESWKTVPWARAKHAKDSMQRLIDILCEIVCLQSELHILTPHQQGLGIDLSAGRVQEKVQMLLLRLQSWRQSVELKLRSCFEAKEQVTRLVTPLTGGSTSIILEKGMGLCQLGTFNMILMYLCRFLTEDNSSPKMADSPACDTDLKISPESRLAARMKPLDLPIRYPDETAHLAAKEIATIWEAVISNGLNGVGTLYLGLPMAVARSLFAYNGDLDAFIEIDVWLAQMPDFWSGKQADTVAEFCKDETICAAHPWSM